MIASRRISPRTSADPDAGYRRILVPLDGSAEAEVALRPAAEIARRCGSDLHLATIRSPCDGGDAGIAVRYLAEVADRVTTTWGCGVRSRLISFGSRGSGVGDLNDYLEADLIVAATMPTPRADHDLLGTSALELMRRVASPVMLVPTDSPPDVRGVIAAVDPTSDPEQDVLRHAKSCARAWDVPLETHVLTGLDAAAGLVAFVESAVEELLVVGRHDQGPLERLLGACDSDAVVRRGWTSPGLLVCPVA